MTNIWLQAYLSIVLTVNILVCFSFNLLFLFFSLKTFFIIFLLLYVYRLHVCFFIFAAPCCEVKSVFPEPNPDSVKALKE